MKSTITTLIWGVLLTGAASHVAFGQPLATELHLDSWGLGQVDNIRHGRLTVVHDDPPRLQVTALSPDAPKPGASGSTTPPAAPKAAGHRVPESGCLLLADGSSGQRNRVGGGLGVFQRAPSQASFDVDLRRHGRRSIALDYRREDKGFAGLWMQLYDPDTTPRSYLDLSGAGSLVLWLRGREGSEQATLKIADRRLDELDDSSAIGLLADFLPQSEILPVWQAAIIPIGSIPRAINLEHAAVLAIEAMAGRGQLEIGRVMACGERQPQLGSQPPEEPRYDPPSRQLELATWVWNTAELLADPALRSALLDRVEAEGLTDVFLQLPGESGQPASLPPGSKLASSSFRRLVASLRGLGVRVAALDGHARFIYPDHREALIAAVREIAAYNKAVPPWARLEAVHYDIEPYLLPEFGGARQQEVLDLWVQTIGALAAEARRVGLEIGLDLPFWLDGSDALGQSFPAVTFADETTSALAHFMRLVDTVVLMDYRTTAFGPNGVLRHAQDEVALAAEHGKRILVGLETGKLLDETYCDFAGEPTSGLPTTIGDWVIVGRQSETDVERVLLVTGEPPSMPEGSWRYWPVIRRIEIPASQLTFADLGRDQLDAVRRQVEWELRDVAAFNGIALHHEASLAELLP